MHVILAWKGKVYRNKPRTLMELQENIRRESEAVTPDVLVNTIRNMERRVQTRLDANGDTFTLATRPSCLSNCVKFVRVMSVSNFTELRRLV